MITITEKLYKYGSLNETNTIEFKNLSAAKEWVDTVVNVGDEPQPEDFYDFDSPQAYEYYYSVWLETKNATPDSCKWYHEFYYKDELLGKGIADL